MTRVARAAVLALLLAGCSDETIVLATIPDTDAGVPAPTRCVQPTDCAAGSFCDLETCLEPAGTCEPFPVECDGDERPVCGCDGITYFNDCLRRAAGVAGATQGECGRFGLACGGPTNEACPGAALCARFLGIAPPGMPPTCPTMPYGTCWVIPAVCPDGGTTDRWDDCSGKAPCAETCAAVRSGDPYVRSGRECQ